MREEDPQEWWNERDKAVDRLLDYFLPLRTPGLDEQERERWAGDAAFWMHVGMLLEHATNATDPSDFRADVLVAHVIEDHELAGEEEADTHTEEGLSEDEQITRRTRHMN
ncbi:MAG TPA: hypothetical protein VN800_03565 [Candidatus Acidoferrales bacterium]|nr:hypothetical protein [Candidatus Acidoferrales bacterium]